MFKCTNGHKKQEKVQLVKIQAKKFSLWWKNGGEPTFNCVSPPAAGQSSGLLKTFPKSGKQTKKHGAAAPNLLLLSCH